MSKASAVHFDGETFLMNEALVSSDNGAASFSMWYKDDSSPEHASAFWLADPLNMGLTYFNNQGVGPGTIQVSFNDQTLGGFLYSTPEDVSLDVWHHVISSVDAETQKMACYIDENLFGLPIHRYAGIGMSTIQFNGLSFWVGNDGIGDFTIGSVADLWVAPGVSLLDGDGNIPLGTIRKFRNSGGKPVFLGENGELPTGTAPAVFLSGDHASFPINKGTGGPFVLTGALSDATGP